MPEKIRAVLMSSGSGAFVRGLTRQYALPVERSVSVARLTIRVAVGEVPFEKLGGVLAVNLKLAPDQARKMAEEIQNDLFGPVRVELEQYWQQKSRGGQKVSPAPSTAYLPPAPSVGANNVLNLKEIPKPPVPPTR